VDLGFDIAFTPHLDDGLNMGQWRNAMRINPLEKHGGMSYLDVVLKPLAEAMAAALKENTYVSWFSGSFGGSGLPLGPGRAAWTAAFGVCTRRTKPGGETSQRPPPETDRSKNARNYRPPRCGTPCRARCRRW
jgi:hypothetical protein